MTLDIRLRLCEPDGTRKRVLKTLTIEWTNPESATPGIRFAVSSRVAGYLSAPFVVGFEYSVDGGAWERPRNDLFIAEEEDADSQDQTQTVTFTGVGLVSWLLSKTYLHWSSSARNGERDWIQFPSGKTGSATPGHMLNGMLVESKNRGWGPHITWDFNALKDSYGTDWSLAGGDLWWEPWKLLTPISNVLGAVSEAGFCEWWAEGTKLRMSVPGAGVNRTESVVLGGAGYSRAPGKSSFRDVFTHLTIVPEKTNWVYMENTGADSRFGRLESTMTQSGVASEDRARVLAKPVLDAGRSLVQEQSFEWSPSALTRNPFADFDIGDEVTVRTRRGKGVQRVIGLVVSKDAAGKVTVRAVTGHKLLGRAQRLAKRVGQQTTGNDVGGTGNAFPVGQVEESSVTPAPPTGLTVVTNEPYFAVDNTARAKVTLSWAPVTASDDGALVGVRSYDVMRRVPGATGGHVVAVVGERVTLDLPSGDEVLVSVRAWSDSDRIGGFSPEITVIPATPSVKPSPPTAPVLSSEIGSVSARWDGLLSDGSPQAGFRHVVTEILNGSVWVRAGQALSSRNVSVITGLTVGIEVSVRFRAISILGNESDPSPVSKITVAGVAMPDIDSTISDAIDEALGTATTAGQLAEQAVQDALDAQDAADQAAQDALAAAGLAGSKGEVIYQASAPTGSRANSANLWIRTSDNKPHTYNGTSWVAVTDKAATDAAAAAAAADGKAVAAQNAANQANQAASDAQLTANAAQVSANTAITSASKRNELFHATTTPSGDGTRAGDIWHQWSSMGTNGMLLATWRWSGSSWVSTQLSETYLPLVNIGSGTYGLLRGDRFEANSITADKILIGDFTNFALDIQNAAEREAFPADGGFRYLKSGVAPEGMPWVLILDPGTGYSTSSVGQPFAVQPGERIYMSYMAARRDGDVPVSLNLQTRDADGNIVNQDVYVARAPSNAERNAWITYSGIVTIPANSVEARPAFKRNSGSPMTGQWYFTNPIIRRAETGDAIIDGAVTSRTMNTNEIWANTAWINAAVANVLTAGVVQSFMLDVATRFPKGTHQNRVPAAMTDAAYWNQVKSGQIAMVGVRGDWASINAAPAGVRLSTDTSQNRALGVMNATEVPASRTIHVTVEGLTSGMRVVIRSWDGPDGTGSILANSWANGGDYRFPDDAVSYSAYLEVGSGTTGSRISRLEIFEVIGSGGDARVEISPTGVAAYDDLGDERVYLGTARDNVLNVQKRTEGGELTTVASIFETGDAKFQQVTAEEVTFGGTQLVGVMGDITYNGQLVDTPFLERYPRGVVYSAGLGTDNNNRLMVTNNAMHQALGSGQAQFDPGRLYTFSIDVSVVARWTAGSSKSGVSLEVWTDTAQIPVDVTTETSTRKSFRWPLLESDLANGTGVTVTFPPSQPFQLSGVRNILVKIVAGNTNGTYQVYNLITQGAPQVQVTDVGPVMDATNGGSIKTRAVSGTAPPPPSQPKTAYFNATWSQLFDSSGNLLGSGGSIYADGRMVQGGHGSRFSYVGFGALGLSGRTITGMWVELQNRHTASSNATVQFGTHTRSSGPGSRQSRANGWNGSTARGAKKRHPIPSGLWSGFASGTYRGITLGGGTGTNPPISTYAIFDGANTSNATGSGRFIPRLIVTYR